MPSTTLRAVRQGGLRKINVKELDPVRTATGGDSNTVTDTAYALPSSTTDHFESYFLKIATSTDGNDPEGDVRAVKDAGYTITGSLDVAVNFSAAVASGDTFEVHEFDPNIFDEVIKEMVRELYTPAFFPLSMYILTSDNNDFEQTTATPVTGLASDTNSTTTAASTQFFNGTQGLVVTPSAAGGYGSLVSTIPVVEGRQMVAAAMGYSTASQSLTLRVWDGSNGASIDTATSDEAAWMELIVSFVIPTDCEALDIRFIADSNTIPVYFDDFQIWYQGRGVYPLPSWITRKEQVIDVVAFPQGTGGPGTNEYKANERMSRKLRWGFEREDLRATNELHIWVDNPSYDRPYIIAERAHPEPSSDTSAINLEPQPLMCGAAGKMLEKKPDKTDDEFRLMNSLLNKWSAYRYNLGIGVPRVKAKSSRVTVR